MKKIFVLDTNVILHDYDCIYNFQDNDVVIPVTVLEEIDNFKKGHDQINFNAREFIRILDRLAGDKIVKTGIRIGKGKGKIRIFTQALQESTVREMFTHNRADHRILSVALHLARTTRTKQVVLVSKDVNLRLKAKALELIAQDYSTDKIQDIDNLYKGKRLITDYPSRLIDRLYQEEGHIETSESNLTNLMPYEYLILKNNKKSALAFFDPEDQLIKRVDKPRAYGIIPRNAEQSFALHALMNNSISLVTISGKAGTGKTLLALAAALEVHKSFNQIFLARPIIPLSNRDMGFLPGDIDAKLDPFMQPLYDNLAVIKNQYRESDKEYKRIQRMLDQEKLHIAPLSYIRGRSLDRIYFIIDEAQNLTPHEVKTIITRAGEGTKVIFTGDPYQIDTPYLDTHSTGLTYLIDRMRGQQLYAHVTLEKGERSKLAELASDLL